MMRSSLLITAVLVCMLATPATFCHASRQYTDGDSISIDAKPPKVSECDDPKFRKSTMKLVKQMPVVGLFKDLRGQTRFETSGMEIAEGYIWLVFDSSYSVGRVELNIALEGKHNELLGEKGDESMFEGLAYVPSRGTFLAHREGMANAHSAELSTLELKMEPEKGDYVILKRCSVEFKPDPRYPNKGFEGLHYFEQNGTEYLLTLCEGNFCTGGKTGKKPGNGRVIVSEYYEDANGCEWKTVKKLAVPPTANFIDYAGLSFYRDMAAIVSQESAAIWVGHFDFNTLSFIGEGKVYHFPRDADCNIAFCNVEGISFIDDTRVVVASDKAKAVQPYGCTLTDQSIQVFAFPSSHSQDEEEEE